MVEAVRRDPREAALLADEAARFSGSLSGRKVYSAPKGPAAYILTSAQNNTQVHEGLWQNLTAYAKHLKATLYVSQFTYNTNAYSAREVKPGTTVPEYEYVWFAKEILPYVYNDRLNLTPSLTFCGELNILPTADRPLNGFENYTNRASGIFPHARQHMQSIASLDAPKFNYTTGCCTLRNYIQKRSGLRAEHHHAYGALIVKVDADGDWIVRQLRATEDGSFYDVAPDGVLLVRDGKITRGHRAEAYQPGDIHVAQIDPRVRKLTWGQGGIVDTLKPRFQFLHDTLDFKSRNHHDSKDPHELFRKYARGQDSVAKELKDCAKFIDNAARPDCQLVVVDSNHDQALTRWLREAQIAYDPANALVYLDMQREVYKAIAADDTDFHLLETVLRKLGVSDDVRFLRPDESFVICGQAGGIECGMHGDRGAGGARGTPSMFAKVGRRANTGHVHAAGILDDLFVAGTCSLLRLNYNRGLSAWSHSGIATFPNGCRQILTPWKGKSPLL